MAPARARADAGPGHPGIDRRVFLGASLGLLLWPAGAFARAPRRLAALPASVTGALEKSPFVYVSPLRSDGGESRCHGEVWYAWIDGAVVLNTASDTWKARAVAGGLDRARIWVGDHGPWKGRLGSRNEAFRQAPHFDARAETSRDAGLVDRLLGVYERKYPDEIGAWRERMRAGVADGSRVVIVYRPDGSART
jgi:hypothetical protein